MDQVIDTKLLCQGEKVGEILLCVDTVQTEVVVVNEVNEQAGGADSDTRKIDDDIFYGLEIQIVDDFSMTTLNSIYYWTFVVGP